MKKVVIYINQEDNKKLLNLKSYIFPDMTREAFKENGVLGGINTSQGEFILLKLKEVV